MVLLVPGEPARVIRDRAATNHQGAVHWPAYVRWSRSVERLERLVALLDDEPDGAEEAIGVMLAPPVRATDVAGGFATLYTAAYRADERSVEYRWPGLAFKQSLADFRDARLQVEIGARGG
jgi:hypothetical protein